MSPAFKLAEEVRFSGDILLRSKEADRKSIDILRDRLFLDGLNISEKTMPLIGKRFSDVCKKLMIDENCVSAFVYASAEIQADCVSVGQSECILRFSSALVELLDPEEFSFVAGHELGHFLLRHSPSSIGNGNSVEGFQIQRAREISADRIGFLASGSIDSSIRALIKTISGLSSRHLRFDVKEFIAQIDKTSERFDSSLAFSTHPSLVFRARALLWFSMCEYLNSSDHSLKSCKTADTKITQDLAKVYDRVINGVIKEKSENLLLWLCAEKIVVSGKFTKEQQTKLLSVFDVTTVDGLKKYLGGLNESLAVSEIRFKIADAEKELESILPVNCELEIRKIREKSGSYF